MDLPQSSQFVIIGAGIHGLSTAYHLALQLKSGGKGSGSDIVVIDKTGVAAGASGIACGVIRNNYFQPAMRELMAHSVDVWESDPTSYSYHPVGYLQLSPEAMRRDVRDIYEQQQRIGYRSELVEGAQDCQRYMRGLFHDWQARGITSVLHEKRGGYANNKASMHGLASKAAAAGVRIICGPRVTGFESSGTAISAVQTDRGAIRTEHVVVAVGPWIKSVWEMLELPKQIDVLAGERQERGVEMWHYMCLQEGTLGVDPGVQKTDDGEPPPVIHLDTDVALHSDIDGSLITDELWGIYYKPDLSFGGIQGGGTPYNIQGDSDDVRVDPYGPESTEFVVGDEFARMWCSGLAFCQKRFEGKYPLFKRDEPSGGIGAFTPDSFPIFDQFRQNCYVIADSNHGYKMLGVGQLVAGELLGTRSKLLEPFRFSRYAEGKLHPVSHSPFPWS